MYWRFGRKTKKRKFLGDLTREEAAKKRRRVQDRSPAGRQNLDVQEENQMQCRRRRRRRRKRKRKRRRKRRRKTDPDLSEGIWLYMYVVYDMYMNILA